VIVVEHGAVGDAGQFVDHRRRWFAMVLADCGDRDLG
jgi:hypothetical protein